jgi:hypothetical protein
MSGRKQHFYRHLDHDSKLTMELDLRKVAEQIASMNYGVHRLLSHLVDVRRESFDTLVIQQETHGRHQLADDMRCEGDRLAEGLAALLESGLC